MQTDRNKRQFLETIFDDLVLPVFDDRALPMSEDEQREQDEAAREDSDYDSDSED